MSLMITAGITALHEKRDDNPFGTPGLSVFLILLLVLSELLILSFILTFHWSCFVFSYCKVCSTPP